MYFAPFPNRKEEDAYSLYEGVLNTRTVSFIRYVPRLALHMSCLHQLAGYPEQPGQIQQLQAECDYSVFFKFRTCVYFKAGADGSHQPQPEPPVCVHISSGHARRIMRLMSLPCAL